jgi:hypothetical protein
MRGLAGFVIAASLLQMTAAAPGSTLASVTDPSSAEGAAAGQTSSETAAPEAVSPVAPINPSQAPVKTAPSANPLWGIPLKQLSNTRDRPIFSSSRRPTLVADPVTPPSVERPREPERPQLALLGTIVNGDDGYGIFMDQVTREPVRIRIGTTYQGWTLRSIKAGIAELENGQDSAQIALPKSAAEQNRFGRIIANSGALLRSVLPRFGGGGERPILNSPPQPASLPSSDQPAGAPAAAKP